MSEGIDRFIPASLGFQNMFDEFAGCAFPAFKVGNEIRGIPVFVTGIFRTSRNADLFKERQIIQIVSHVSGFFPGKSVFFQQAFQCFDLVFNAGQNEVSMELPCAGATIFENLPVMKPVL